MELVDSYFWHIGLADQSWPYSQVSEGVTKKVLTEYAQRCAMKIIVGGRVLLDEMTISRMVDNFITYLSEISVFALRSAPPFEAFDSARISNKELSDLLDNSQSLDDLRHTLLSRLTKQQIDAISRNNWSEITDWFEKHLDFYLFSDLDTHLRIAHIIALRNSIIHHRGVMKLETIENLLKQAKRFAGKYRKGKDSKAMDRLLVNFQRDIITMHEHKIDNNGKFRWTPSEILEAVSLVIMAVEDIDERAIKQFDSGAS